MNSLDTLFTATIESTAGLTGEATARVQRTADALNLRSDTLDNVEASIRKGFSADEGWFVYRGGSHVALHRVSGGDRVLLVAERIARTTLGNFGALKAADATARAEAHDDAKHASREVS